MEFLDSYRHKELRARLVQEISLKGIRDQRVLEAVGKVPRHLFMESGFVQFAYVDKAFPIGAGQTISQPYTVAFQTELLQVEPGQLVLEIGTGSGYQAAILCELGAKVYTIERQKQLFEKVRQFLPCIGYYPFFYYGDGSMGLPTDGPFDGIIVTAATREIPEDLLNQLKIGGRMVIPVGGAFSQKMTLVVRLSETEFDISTHGDFVFVPLLGGKSE